MNTQIARMPLFALLCAGLLAGCPQDQGQRAEVEASVAVDVATGEAGSTAAAVSTGSPVSTSAAIRFVPGDVTGDGRSDIQIASLSPIGPEHPARFLYTWVMEGNQIVGDDFLYGAEDCFQSRRKQVAIGDFNGDRVGDYLHVGSDDRSVCVSLGRLSAFSSVVDSATVVGTHAPGWMPVGAADADGDGKSDIILVNQAARLVGYWRMDGASIAGFSPAFGWPEGATELRVLGDFNGDGRVDLVWDEGSLWIGTPGGFESYRPSGLLPAGGWKHIGAGDIDGDGRDDLVLVNARSSHVAYWLMDGPVIRAKSIAFAAPAGFRLATFGDYNGDGNLDLVWADSDRYVRMWLGDGFGFNDVEIKLARSPSTGTYRYSHGFRIVESTRQRHVRGDMRGDGRSDLILVNEAFGHWHYWTMRGALASPIHHRVFDMPGGRYVTTGDFDGDGRTEVVWVSDSDGTMRMTFIDDVGGVNTRTSVKVNIAGGWRIRAAADIDGDGRDDLILYNEGLQKRAFWLMDGARVAFYSEPQDAHMFETAADLSHDGTGGVVESNSGAITYRKLLTSRADTAVTRLGDLASGWWVAGAADIDGNGQSDLIVQNHEGVAFWILGVNGGVLRYSPGFLQPAGYRLAAIGDYDADGLADLIWARESDGSLLFWKGNGEGFESQAVNIAFRSGFRVVQP
ncbi:MAG: FG-GAP repeat domain-containing protein [Gammaproteobacteria bacterium]